MALVKCSDCGESVSSLADACPKCGAPVSWNDDKQAARVQQISAERLAGNLWMLKAGAFAVVAMIVWFYYPVWFAKERDVEIQVTGSMVPARIVYSDGHGGKIEDEFVPPKTFQLKDVKDNTYVEIDARLVDAEGDLVVQVINKKTGSVMQAQRGIGETATVYASFYCCVD